MKKGGSEATIEMSGTVRVCPPDIVVGGYFSEEPLRLD